MHCSAREPSFRYATKNIARRWRAKHAFVDAELGLKRRSPYKMTHDSQIAILFYVNNTVEVSSLHPPSSLQTGPCWREAFLKAQYIFRNALKGHQPSLPGGVSGNSSEMFHEALYSSKGPYTLHAT